MKNIRILNTGIAILCLTLAFSFASCSKERIEPKENLEEYEEADEYLESKKAEEQEYEITEDGNGPLIGKKGTKVWLSKDILEYQNGDSVHYPYTIKLIELYTPKDMIYYQMPSMAGSQLLTTHGEIRVRAFKDGVELRLRDNKFWIVEIPKSNAIDSMICYYGNEDNNIVDWVDKGKTTFDVIGSGYHGEIDALGWISCAKKAFGEVQTINLSFYSDSISLNNVTTFIYLPKLKGLMQVYNQNSSPLPMDESMKIVSLAKQGEQLYNFYLQDAVSDENRIEIILTPTTDLEHTSILNNL